MFEIGVMRRLDLGAERRSLEELFRRWVRSLYGLVEIENAYRLDTSIRVEPLGRGESSGALARTPYRLQFGIEAHRRFLGQTVPIVCRRIARLFEATGGACSARGGVRALDDELERILAGTAGRAARDRCDELERTLERDGATATLDGRLTELQDADAEYLSAAKQLVACGVRAFEVHEADVLTERAERLLDPLRGVLSLTDGFFEASARWPGGEPRRRQRRGR